MAPEPTSFPPTDAFSEKSFYLAELRGRTLAIAARAEELGAPAPLESVLAELADNQTRVVVISTDPAALEALLGQPPHAASAPRLEAAVWRGFGKASAVGVAVEEAVDFARGSRGVAQRLGLSKLVCVDPEGGLRREEGGRGSFVDLEALRELVRGGLAGMAARRAGLLREIEAALDAGLAAVNLTTLEGLSDELFTYAGSGTLFTRERYVLVRRLGLDDYDAAEALISRGVAEGFLAPRSPEQIDGVLANGFGAFVEGRHLAGIGALLDHPEAGAGEIAALYTLTRFLGEGVGGHLLRFVLEQADARGRAFVFACTTAERVAGFFERHGFERVGPERIPAEKWRAYDAERRQRLHCLRRDLSQR